MGISQTLSRLPTGTTQIFQPLLELDFVAANTNNFANQNKQSGRRLFSPIDIFDQSQIDHQNMLWPTTHIPQPALHFSENSTIELELPHVSNTLPHTTISASGCTKDSCTVIFRDSLIFDGRSQSIIVERATRYQSGQAIPLGINVSIFGEQAINGALQYIIPEPNDHFPVMFQAMPAIAASLMAYYADTSLPDPGWQIEATHSHKPILNFPVISCALSIPGIEFKMQHQASDMSAYTLFWHTSFVNVGIDRNEAPNDPNDMRLSGPLTAWARFLHDGMHPKPT